MNNKEEWQIPHVKLVLAYHNSVFCSAFNLNGRCEDYRPELQGGWDWVCNDPAIGKGAIEVKRLTDQQKHKEDAIIQGIGTELERELSPKLKGIYRLLIQYESLPSLIKTSESKANKVTELKKTIRDVFLRKITSIHAAQAFIDIADLIREELPSVGTDFYAEIYKVADSGNHLSVEFMNCGNAPSGTLVGTELAKFKDSIKIANRQLSEAKKRGFTTTFLILLDLMYFLGATASVLTNTFSLIEPQYHSNIDYIYYDSNVIKMLKPIISKV